VAREGLLRASSIYVPFSVTCRINIEHLDKTFALCSQFNPRSTVATSLTDQAIVASMRLFPGTAQSHGYHKSADVVVPPGGGLCGLREGSGTQD
jgi:hypothetical protein